jgi:hypothetical protein
MNTSKGLAGMVVVAGAALMIACGGSSSSDTNQTESPSVACAAPCQHVVECEASAPPDAGTPLTQDECVAQCVGVNFTEECRNAFGTATCEDINATPTPVSLAQVCFPACSPDGAQCQAGGKIRICNNGQQLLVNCTYVCSLNNLKSLGVCGLTYQGQQSSTGQDVCWCG